MSGESRQEQRERVKRRIRAAMDPDRYDYRPETVQNYYVKSDVYQRVVIYARVSTNNPSQTSSFELQQKYYEELVAKYPKWELVKIYADEGKSGTTTEHRPEFLQMMEDAKAGKFDLIITKNISRLNRNTVHFLNTIRKLSAWGIGVYFESEAVYSLNQDTTQGVEFQAVMAEQESRNRSRSMETSIRMRLDHGLPLTPELLGLMHDENGKLILNPETANTPKLMFYCYLYGYSTQQIADFLTKLIKKTYLGNVKWTAGGVARILRSERYCGDVQTRKRFKKFAADVPEGGQKTFKNRGQKPQSYYHGEHEAIISYADYLAVQRIMDNAKYGGTSILPELRVIEEGLLKGFVIVHPHWSTFTVQNYIDACRSAGVEDEPVMAEEEGAFDLRGYEKAKDNLFSDQDVPYISLQQNRLIFSAECVKRVNCGDYIELLVHPVKKQIAIRPAPRDGKYTIRWAKGFTHEPRPIACMAFIQKIYEMFGWQDNCGYRLYGTIYRDGGSTAEIFSTSDATLFINKDDVTNVPGKLLGIKGKLVRGFNGDYKERIGNEYYKEKSLTELRHLTKEQWQMGLEGRACNTGLELNVTPYEELRAFIQEQLGDLFEEE